MAKLAALIGFFCVVVATLARASQTSSEIQQFASNKSIEQRLYAQHNSKTQAQHQQQHHNNKRTSSVLDNILHQDASNTTSQTQQQHAGAKWPLSSHHRLFRLPATTNSDLHHQRSKFQHSDISSQHTTKQQQQQQQQQQPQQQKRTSLLKKICMGTSHRLSGQHNKTDHYQNLADRYRNCTYVIGNLELTWLGGDGEQQDVDLSFLESIREITGYLLIAHVNVERVRMPNLQIIRGRDLLKSPLDDDNNNNADSAKEEFAMVLINNELRALELPNLREILAGSVGSYNNSKLCHIRSISWDEIISLQYRSVFNYAGTPPDACAPCDLSCGGSCWAEGPEMCQKFSKNGCSEQCGGGSNRCFGPTGSECCHSYCAGGCTGPNRTDCLACKNFYDDGECVQECPSMQRYNSKDFLWEQNPDGKYAFGATCVKECPEHMLRDNGACVRTCPPNKRAAANGECVPCGGPCQKNCTGVEVVHSGNIDQLINCTVIEGSLTISDASFTGQVDSMQQQQQQQQPQTGNTSAIQPRFKPMHPSRLEVFKTLREITGYLSIQANHTDFRDLSYFRNLKTIGGRQTTDMFYSLVIAKTSLVSLNLRSLRKVRSGRVLIEDNKELCFADTIDWAQLNLTRVRDEIITRNNADAHKCRAGGARTQCHEQCAQDGCWGPSPDECLSCNNYKLDEYCVHNCSSALASTSQTNDGFAADDDVLAYDAGGRTCRKCHAECRGGCNGAQARDCWQCKHVQDGPHCVAQCPSHKFNNKSNICVECHKSCADGCTGTSSRLGEGGCNSCAKAIIDYTPAGGFVASCIKLDEPCPQGYYQEYVGPQAEGPLKSSSGKPVCRKCHSRCKSCTGMGTHVSVCECARYVAGEQCEDACPRDTYADESQRRCVKCSPECNGCYGPTEAHCNTCRVYRVYYDAPPDSALLASEELATLTAATAAWSISGARSQASFASNNYPQQQQSVHKFNCTAQCPADKPHRISESNMLDPYCSDEPGVDFESTRSLGATSVLLLLMIIVSALMVCVSVYRCQIEKDKTVKLTMHLSGIDDVEPLTPSNLAPNLAPLRSIKETELRWGNLLGSGFGGKVFQGFWYPEGEEHTKRRPVAIKVLKDSNMNKEFLEEAYIMASVNHPNLVRLLAVCMTPNDLMLITQLMPLGCLLTHVQKYKTKIGSKNLFEWCKQIARGMSYLEEHRMVHRDLALRNVLLQSNRRALISDFGLAKLLDINQSEYQSGGGRLPIKWLAPECIRERKFTHKSDVWAFGVTVWELLTFGARPFDEYDTRDVPVAIEKGARLGQPEYMSAEVYKVMYSCWFYTPEERPSFAELTHAFAGFARDPGRFLLCPTKGGLDYDLQQQHMQHLQHLQHDMIDASAYEDDSDVEAAAVDEDELDVDDAATGSAMDSEHDEHAPTSASLMSPELTPSTHNRINETFRFEMHHQHHHHHHHQQQHHQAEQSVGPALSTPILKRIGLLHSPHNCSKKNQHMIGEEDVFVEEAHASTPRTPKSVMFAPDSNNNYLRSSQLDVGAREYQQPTDMYDYLLPSHCAAQQQQQQHRAANALRPPLSAGIVSFNNEEYFQDETRTRLHSSSGLSVRPAQLACDHHARVHTRGRHDDDMRLIRLSSTESRDSAVHHLGRLSTSSGNIPQSLV